MSSIIISIEPKEANNSRKPLKPKSNTKGKDTKKGWKQWLCGLRGKDRKESEQRVSRK